MIRQPQDIIVRPLLTEKSTLLTQTANTLTFDVLRSANKIEIKAAVQALFNVKVDSVRLVRVPGKIRKVGRSIGRAQDRKKAYVKLKAGEKLPAIFEGV